MMKAAFHDDQWTPEQFRRVLTDAPDVLRTFIIEHDGLPVATASSQFRPNAYPGSGVVHWVAVDPAHRGLKLGYIVSLAVLHDFAQRGLKDAVLETQDERLPAIKTYRNLGFEPEHTDETHLGRWAEVMSRLLQAINL
jgi:mycothiol synthase